MGESDTYPAPEPIVTYYPEDGMLYVETGRPFGDGETIAKNIVVFHDRECPSKVVGICFEFAPEVILKPFVDAELVRRGIIAPAGAE